MKKLIQTRLHVPGKVTGNCWPTVLACFMDLENPEQAFQVQEHFEEDGWYGLLLEWLKSKGWVYTQIDGHRYDDTFYLVSGTSPRNAKIKHICIYQNGKMYHDPHPDNTGITTEDIFEIMFKI